MLAWTGLSSLLPVSMGGWVDGCHGHVRPRLAPISTSGVDRKRDRQNISTDYFSISNELPSLALGLSYPVVSAGIGCRNRLVLGGFISFFLLFLLPFFCLCVCGCVCVVRERPLREWSPFLRFDFLFFFVRHSLSPESRTHSLSHTLVHSLSLSLSLVFTPTHHPLSFHFIPPSTLGIPSIPFEPSFVDLSKDSSSEPDNTPHPPLCALTALPPFGI